MRLKLHPEAEEEIFQDAAWYDEQRTGLGDEFLQHVDRWFGVILETPRVWPLEVRDRFQHRVLGLALEAYRRQEISRGKLEELASMLGIDRDRVGKLLEDSGLEDDSVAAELER